MTDEQVPEPTPPQPVLDAQYRVSALGRWHAAPVLALAAMNLVVIVAALAAGAGARAIAAVVVLGGLAAAIVWFWGFQIATVVELDDGALRWASVLRQGSIPLDRLAAVRPSRAQFRLVVFEWVGGRGQLVLGGPALAAFVAAVQHLRPDLPVDLPTLGTKVRSRTGGVDRP